MIFEKPKKINKWGVLCETKFSKVKMSEAENGVKANLLERSRKRGEMELNEIYSWLIVIL